MYWKPLIILGLLLLFFLIYNYYQIGVFFVNQINLKNNKILKSFKITQITDYHANQLIHTKKLLNEIIDYNPHIIVLTGDIIDSKTKEIEPTLDLIEKLLSINTNIYFVIGNHELGNKNGDGFIAKLKELGVNVLDNGKHIFKNDENVNIVGLNFYATREDYQRTVEGINKDYYTILLSHSPNRPIEYSEGLEDLILSGHTHGGQVRFPIVGAVVAPGQGFFPKYDKGIFDINGVTLYIDSGLGNSIFPIRLFNRVQLSNITISPVGMD